MPDDPCPLTILVVEDDDQCREAIRRLLKGLGHVVDVAADGPTGVAKALAAPPDVVVTDIGLPGFDGFEVARRIRAALGPSVVLIAQTGNESHDARGRAAAAGIDHFLVKPADQADFMACLGCKPRGSTPSS